MKVAIMKVLVVNLLKLQTLDYSSY